MAETRTPTVTEPVAVPCVLAEHALIEVRDELVRIVGFADLDTVEGEMPERRIVVRVAVPLTAARALVVDLRRALARGGN